MLDFIKGEAVIIKPNKVVIEVGGIGFSVKVPFRVSQQIQKKDEVQLFTSLNLKEDAIELYGFLEVYERELFEELIKISGIGPTTAMNILSTYDRESLKNILEKEDIKALSRVPGIGKKTAQRILLELRGVLPYFKYEQDQKYDDILAALLNLGYKRNEAKETLDKIYNKDKDEASIIKECLRVLTDKNA